MQNCKAVGVITIAKILSGDINVFLTSGFDNAKSIILCNILPIINHMLNASLKFESQALSYMYMHMQDTEIEIYLK